MAIDINGLSAKELNSLISQAKKRQTTLKKRKSATTVRARLTALAKAEGYTVAELFGGGASAGGTGTGGARSSGTRASGAAKAPARKGRKLGKVAPKYRNPAQPTETWSGRGKHPRWMADQIKDGKKVEDFLIGS